MHVEVQRKRSREPLSTRPPTAPRRRSALRGSRTREAIRLEELAASWRASLDAAEIALRACADSLPAPEVAARAQRVNTERTETLRLLTAVARVRGLPTRFLHLHRRGDLRRMLAVPPAVNACVFELEGVLAPSIGLHVAAWQEAFDRFLEGRTDQAGRPVGSFHPRTDYLRYVHGRPRLEGVSAFLESRGIAVPMGTADDPPGAPTIHGLANRKLDQLLHLVEARGVEAFDESLHYLRAAKEAGLGTAVVSASANMEGILERSALRELVDATVDGGRMVAERLQPWPAPDVLLAACRSLGVDPATAAAYEATQAGIAAARAAGFAIVFGVDRTAQPQGPQLVGADRAIPGLGALLENGVAA